LTKNNYRNIEFYKKRIRRSFYLEIKRRRRKKKNKAGYYEFIKSVRKLHPKQKTRKTNFSPYLRSTKLGRKPKIGETIEFFKNNHNAFSGIVSVFTNTVIEMPQIFSLLENYEESSIFLKKLFNTLSRQSLSEIILDYNNCRQIDVDASICMDIMLYEFIRYFKICRNQGHPVKVQSITARNYSHYDIKKILFSIGTFKILGIKEIKFENITPYHLCIGDKEIIDYPKKREVDITQMVDYIINCLFKMNRNLTAEAEDSLYKVIGEVMINAEEHSNTNKRFSIGYFEETVSNSAHIGIFNLSIMNFGQTIYESFKSPNCKNQKVVKQMQNLSEKYTHRKFFKKAEFEEETLWSLYALQEGVTRKLDWKRGNGSIRFIENFFKLKGDDKNDDKSKMIITSGNTRIIFNGEYTIFEKPRLEGGKPYKMMTFNSEKDLDNKPDKKYVHYAENYFPGTLISAKIWIDYNSTEIL
jgi:hypothetical protein